VTKPALKYQIVVSEMFAENAYIAHLDGSSECLIIDPGLDWEGIVDHVARQHLVPVALLNTHGHADHIAGNQGIKQRWPEIPLIIGRGDAEKLTDPVKNLSAGYGFGLTSPAADKLVSQGDQLSLAGIDLDVIETPGHSVGHVVFLWKGASPWIAFAGDVLFRDSIGRTDFPDGSFEQLAGSIHRQLFTLPGDTIILPGHGEATTVEYEKRNNPFVGERAGFQSL
jgi:glyoxylase-like metal-dependent hydrolase (beta-lactamase superfamily II)